jgi:hypothetical protein
MLKKNCNEHIRNITKTNKTKTMLIDESRIIEDMDESKAAAILLDSGDIFMMTKEFIGWNTSKYKAAVLFVNCNDVFAWACADCEEITENDGEEPSEIIELYKCYKQSSKWGGTRWVCIKRKEKPQDPIVEAMKKDGQWDEVMENLPPNYYWTKIKENRK